MELVHAPTVLMAALFQARPTGTEAHELENVARDTAVSFIAYTSQGRPYYLSFLLLRYLLACRLMQLFGLDCSSSGVSYSLSGAGKGNFPNAKHSIKVIKMYSAYHLSLYSAPDQGGPPALQPNGSNISQCRPDAGNCWSYGVFWIDLTTGA
ncbi:hypothetical protein RRF57_007884 [Xylaria bambusicola]|uniref:Uncharacterized protein n=1 Tax=Xylaria bambusicola TaxID=326684 RepID=A0AAN7UGV7_9PEZI